MAVECDRWNWRELIASEHGPSTSNARHVLHAISLNMKQDGTGAFPSQETLAKKTKLSVRAVRKHLDLAEREEFVAVYQRRRDKQAWFVHEYVATIPDRLEVFCKSAPWEEDPTWKRPAPRAARTSNPERRSPEAPSPEGQRPAHQSERPAPNDTTPGTSVHNARHDVPTNLLLNSPYNYPKERAAEDRTTGVFLNKGEIRTEEPECKHQPFPETPTSAQEAFQGKSLKRIATRPASGYVYSDEELEAKIEKLRAIKVEPETVVAVLRNYATDERIRRILCHKYGVPWISAA